jgi:membrane-associated phospholipid phosphatase
LQIISKKSYRILGLLFAVLGSAMTVQIGKHIWKINRPVQYSYYHMDSYSFPSGHATAAVAFYGIVFYLLIRLAKRRLTKFVLLISGLAIILLIGFSRMYLCEHFLSDVVGGYLLGFLWLLLSISVILWKEDRMRIQ